MNLITSERNEEETPLLKKASKEKTTCFIYLVSVISSLGGFFFGYDTGIMSGALIFIKESFSLDSWWQELTVSATVLNAFVFSLVAGQATDRWGRRPVIIAASCIFIAGAILMSLSWTKYILLVGRLTLGVAIGLAYTTVPMFIAEVAPSHIRGQLVTLNDCFINGGQFVSSLIAVFFSSYGPNGWRYMLGAAVLPGIIQFVAFLFIPESPRWLVKQKKYDRALQALKTFRGSEADVREEFESIKKSCLKEEQRGERKSMFVEILNNRSLKRAVIVGCALQMMQQVSGLNTVMYYSATIIQMSGIRDKQTAVWLAALVAAVNFSCTFIGLVLVERIGRRLLTLGSLAGVILSLLVLAVGFHLALVRTPAIGWQYSSDENLQCIDTKTCSECIQKPLCGFCYVKNETSFLFHTGNFNGTCLLADQNHSQAFGKTNFCSNGTVDDAVWSFDECPSQLAFLTFFGLVMYLFFFAPGMGPMPLTINSEIYPLWARSFCYALSTAVCWLFNLLVSISFLSLINILTKRGVFYLYAILATAGFCFFYFRLPETKGCSLEEVESLFENRDAKILSKTKGHSKNKYSKNKTESETNEFYESLL